MLNVVLVEPEIPQNTGNIARTCAATGARLHLIEPLGFSLDDRYLKRAGLDYWNLVDLRVYESLTAFFSQHRAGAFFFATTKAVRRHTDACYPENAFLVFGKETKGLPAPLLAAFPDALVRIPMRADARSLNLSSSVAVLLYEALRQTGFPGLLDTGRSPGRDHA